MNAKELNDLFTTPRSGLSVHRIGAIELPSGRVTASDPLVLQGLDLSFALAPGKYAVEVLSGVVADWGERNAATRLLLSKSEPVRFEPVGVVGVDTGLVGFYPPEVVPALRAVIDDQSIFDRPELKKRLMRDVLEFGGLSAAFASSGFGDGAYGLFVGYEANGRPAVALIDCAVVDELFDADTTK